MKTAASTKARADVLCRACNFVFDQSPRPDFLAAKSVDALKGAREISLARRAVVNEQGKAYDAESRYRGRA